MYRLKLFAILIITQAFTHVFATVNVIYNPEDSVEIERWLSEAPSGKTPNELTLYFANKMIGRPYVAHTLERSDSECLIINMKEFDCTTLVENSAAMAITAKQGKKRFSDYCDVLRSLRYRNGEITDYSSKLHYFSEWIKYNCEQSNNIAALTRELIDEQYPDRLLKVYSGYEYDFDPYKDLTRRLYAVDWNSMADTFIDYAGAGYYGSRQDLSHTAEVLSGRTVYIPAEMYVENFLTKNIGDLSPEKWAMRLIEVFMNSGMRGMTYWYANDMDGAALIAVSEFTKFVLLVEDFALRGTFDPDAISVMPKTEADNVYVIRDTKQAMVVALNRSDKPKRIRLTLNDFKIKGYTSDLQITDMVSGEKIPANRESNNKNLILIFYL